jgi:2-haloacid dehalogenase
LSIPVVKALTFDVFGTVADWRTSITDEGRRLGAARGIEADCEAFADAWRAGYEPAMKRVRLGEMPWTNIDSLHGMILDELLPRFGITGLDDADREDFNRAWHRLSPCPT